MMRFLPPRAEFHTPLGVSLFSVFGTVVLVLWHPLCAGLVVPMPLLPSHS